MRNLLAKTTTTPSIRRHDVILAASMLWSAAVPLAAAFAASSLHVSLFLSATDIRGAAFVAPHSNRFPRRRAAPNSHRTVSSALNLDSRVARMVDDEYYRETHLTEFDKRYHKRNDPFNERRLPQSYDAAESDFAEPVLHMQQRKDRRMAKNDPQRYCADRCLATGYCDAFEDFFHLSADEVVQFCTECVLSEDEEPCDIPYGAMDRYASGEFAP